MGADNHTKTIATTTIGILNVKWPASGLVLTAHFIHLCIVLITRDVSIITIA